MTSYRMRLSDRQKHVGRCVFKAQREIARAVLEAKTQGLTQQAIAEKLGVNRSVVNRQVSGQANLTLRSIAELGWAIGMEPRLSFIASNAKGSAKLSEPAHLLNWEVLPWHPHVGERRLVALDELAMARSANSVDCTPAIVPSLASLNDDDLLVDEIAQAA